MADQSSRHVPKIDILTPFLYTFLCVEGTADYLLPTLTAGDSLHIILLQILSLPVAFLSSSVAHFWCNCFPVTAVCTALLAGLACCTTCHGPSSAASALWQRQQKVLILSPETLHIFTWSLARLTPCSSTICMWCPQHVYFCYTSLLVSLEIVNWWSWVKMLVKTVLLCNKFCAWSTVVGQF